MKNTLYYHVWISSNQRTQIILKFQWIWHYCPLIIHKELLNRDAFIRNFSYLCARVWLLDNWVVIGGISDEMSANWNLFGSFLSRSYLLTYTSWWYSLDFYHADDSSLLYLFIFCVVSLFWLVMLTVLVPNGMFNSIPSLQALNSFSECIHSVWNIYSKKIWFPNLQSFFNITPLLNPLLKRSAKYSCSSTLVTWVVLVTWDTKGRNYFLIILNLQLTWRIKVIYLNGRINYDFFNRLSRAVCSCNRSFGELHLFGTLQFITELVLTCDSVLSPLRYQYYDLL